MKANEAPENIYFEVNNNLIGLYDSAILGMFSVKKNKTAIEYTRTDAFIEKACSWLENNLQGIVGGSIYIEDFRKYMKGE